MDLTHRSDDQLLLDVGRLVGSHRMLTAKLVVHLAEIEERRLHLRAGFPSMFEFCMRELGFSEGEAFRRILAARLFVRFPVVYDLLASGKVHLSALELLRDHLADDNHRQLFETVAGMSKRQVDAYLAARFPKPDAPSRISRAPIQPLSEARFKVEFTASSALRDKLELCRDLLSHANPTRDLAVVIERAVDLLMHDLERKRLAKVKRPRRRTTVDGASGTVDGANGKTNRRQPYDPSQARNHARERSLEQILESGSNENARNAESLWGKIGAALIRLGFRTAEARRAIAEARGKHPQTPPLELALREAVHAATTRIAA